MRTRAGRKHRGSVNGRHGARRLHREGPERSLGRPAAQTRDPLGSSSNHLRRIRRNALENIYTKTGQEAILWGLSPLGHVQEKRGSGGTQPALRLAANGHFSPEKSRNVLEDSAESASWNGAGPSIRKILSQTQTI